MVFTSSNNFSEGWTIVLLLLNEVPISPLHIDNRLLFALVHRVIPICMEKRAKNEDRTLPSPHHSMRVNHAMVLLPIVNTFPQAASLF
jgi:hypothetical protein